MTNFTFRLITILTIALFAHTSYGQQRLALEVSSSDANREVLSLSNTADGILSAVIFSMASGTSNSNAAGRSTISTYSNSYTASPSYAGFLDLQGMDTGVLLRASEQNGVIRFLTGGSTIASQTRMFIGSTGNVGVGTSNPHSRLEVASGDIHVSDSNGGVVLKADNSTCWKLFVTNAGTLTTASVSCP